MTELKFSKPVKKERLQVEELGDKIEYVQTTPESYDGSKAERYLMDEVGVWGVYKEEEECK